MNEIKIPVYWRALTEHIGFPTLSADGTILIGHVLGAVGTHGTEVVPDDASQVFVKRPHPSRPAQRVIFMSVAQAIAHARAGLDGLRFVGWDGRIAKLLEPAAWTGSGMRSNTSAPVRLGGNPEGTETVHVVSTQNEMVWRFVGSWTYTPVLNAPGASLGPFVRIEEEKPVPAPATPPEVAQEPVRDVWNNKPGESPFRESTIGTGPAGALMDCCRELEAAEKYQSAVVAQEAVDNFIQKEFTKAARERLEQEVFPGILPAAPFRYRYAALEMAERLMTEFPGWTVVVLACGAPVGQERFWRLSAVKEVDGG